LARNSAQGERVVSVISSRSQTKALELSYVAIRIGRFIERLSRSSEDMYKHDQGIFEIRQAYSRIGALDIGAGNVSCRFGFGAAPSAEGK
jgi:hypothetical protein